MKFPNIEKITTTSVIQVLATSTIGEALDTMLNQNHRSVVVVGDDEYRILTVMDIFDIQRKKTDFNIKLSELNLSIIPSIDKNKNILSTLEYLNNSVEYICVLNSDKTLYGLVTHTDITGNIDPDILMEHYKLTDFLKLGRRMKWVKKDVLTSVLLYDMMNGSFDNVVVVENMKPIGILTTKDVMNLIKQKSNLDVVVEKYMSFPVDTIGKDSSIKVALEFLKRKHYKRDGCLSGIITQKELISLTYSRWAILMKEYHEELHEINIMLENKNRKYETLASTDSLTGLYNRYKFSELYLTSYTTMIQRHNDMSLIILDIDFFKKVNDIYGHNTGDAVLVQVAHTLLKTLRNIDIVCRWGGEEFLILLPTASLDNTCILAEKLRVNIEQLQIDGVNGVTISLGVSQVREGEEMQESIDRADKALYLAKKSGRNCVKSEEEL